MKKTPSLCIAGIVFLFWTGFVLSGDPIKIFLAGDSTMAEKLPEKWPETGWGEALQAFFDTTKVVVENHARNGRSTRTFLEEGRWQTLIGRVNKGDYVFIQFGHNDESKQKADRYTPPEQYRANLRRFVQDVRSKEATPVLVTPIVRRRFDSSGTFYDVHGVYPDVVRDVAKELNVPLIDMHRMSEDTLKSYGPERSEALFLLLKPGEYANYPNGLTDDTHFSPAGAAIMAGMAVKGIRDLHLGLEQFLVPQAVHR